MTPEDAGTEDQADVMWVGSIGPIPIFHEDDPRVQEQFARKRSAQARVAALPDLDSLFSGLADGEAYVRKFCADEIGRQGQDDVRYVPQLLSLLQNDLDSGVRLSAAFALCNVDPGAEAKKALHHCAANDDNEHVRWSARFALFQLDEGPNPMEE